MLAYVKKLLVLLLVPAGIVLLFFPLQTSQKKFVDAEYVFLIAGPIQGSDTGLDSVTRVSKDQLQTFPLVLAAVLDRKETIDFYLKPDTDDDGLQGLESLEKSISRLDGVSSEESEKYQKDLEQRRAAIRESEDQRKMIRLNTFKVKQKSWGTQPAEISVDEWISMRNSLLRNEPGKTTFIFQDALYEGTIRYDSDYVSVPVWGLAAGRKIAGAVFLLIGLFLSLGIYRNKKGIMIARPGIIFLWDCIVTGISVFFVYGALDLFFMKVFQTPMCTEEFIQFMGVFWVVLAIPCIALFIAASAAQSIRVTEQGVFLDGLFSKRFIPWGELTGIEVSEINAVKRTGGVSAPKQIMKVLRLEGENSSMTVMEPPLKSTKKRILDTMLAHAPQEWHETINEKGKAWQAFF